MMRYRKKNRRLSENLRSRSCRRAGVSRRLNEGTHNFEEYNWRTWGKDYRMPILFFDPKWLLDDESRKEVVMNNRDIDEEEFSELSEEEIQKEVDLEYDVLYDDAVAAVDHIADSIIRQSFGDLYRSGLKLEHKPGYYFGCQWLFDEDALDEMLGEAIEDAVYELIVDRLSGILDDSDILDLSQDIAYAESSGKDCSEAYRNWLKYADEDTAREAKKILDSLKPRFHGLEESFRDRIIECADKAIRKIAKDSQDSGTDLQVAYSSGGWGSPTYLDYNEL